MKQSLLSRLLLTESFNKVISQGKRDDLVRFWTTAENRVSTHYVNSVFMGKTTKADVLENFEAASEGLNKNIFIQVLPHGPNVSLKFLELLAEKRKYDGLNKFISIGNCSLHTAIEHFKMQNI